MHTRSNHPLHTIRHYLRCLYYYSILKNFNNFLIEIQKKNCISSIPAYFVDFPLRRYLDNRWRMNTRFINLENDIKIFSEKIGSDRFRNIIENNSIKIFSIFFYTIHLEINSISPYDGFWAISIKNIDGDCIYNLSFGFLSENTILIGSIQGAKSDNFSEINHNRIFTKLMHGYRPQNFLYSVISHLCLIWKIDCLYGVDPQFIGASTFINKSNNHFSKQYYKFYGEINAKRKANGYFKIPIKNDYYDLNQIESKKRSQYRKRNLLLKKLFLNISTILCNEYEVPANKKLFNCLMHYF